MPSAYEICTRPGDFFSSPDELLKSSRLTRAQKLQALSMWETDERLKMVATEENMAGGTANQLEQVQKCLRALEGSWP